MARFSAAAAARALVAALAVLACARTATSGRILTAFTPAFYSKVYNLAPSGLYYVEPMRGRGALQSSAAGGSNATTAAAATGSCTPLLDALRSNSDLSQLASALSSQPESLKRDVSGGRAITLFAPSNGAFDALQTAEAQGRAGGAGELLRNSTLLTATLSYHVVRDRTLRAADLQSGQNLQTALRGVPLLVRARSV